MFFGKEFPPAVCIDLGCCNGIAPGAAHDSLPYLCAIVTARRLRPLARRRLSTARPDRVCIRARNPWVCFRLLLWGWYVRFKTHTPEVLRRVIDSRPYNKCQVSSLLELCDKPETR